MKAKNFSQRKAQAAGWPVNITTYQLGHQYYCTVDNVSPGAWIAKSEGSSREDAEKRAIERATELLAKTRKIPVLNPSS